MANEQLKLINGNGLEFREGIGRRLVTAILKRDEVEYNNLRRELHPIVNLSVVPSRPSCGKRFP